MKAFASLFALSMALTAATETTPATKVDYRFGEVRRTVTLLSHSKESAATKGTRAESGDKVSTGWFSYALIESDAHKAKFELFSSTEVELASTEPGVILSLNRGKLHAMFDKITGTEPRVVKTPGALLAVRGTQYTVEVDKTGNTTLDVSEGTVEIRSPLRPQPMFVHAGEAANFGRQMPPSVHPRGEGGPNQGRPDGQHGQPPGNGQPGNGPGGPHDGHGTGMPGTGGQPQGGPGGGHGAPPPPPPPGGHP